MKKTGFQCDVISPTEITGRFDGIYISFACFFKNIFTYLNLRPIMNLSLFKLY